MPSPTQKTEKLRALLKSARDIAAVAESQNRNLTAGERSQIDAKLVEASTLKTQITTDAGIAGLEAQVEAIEGSPRGSTLDGRRFQARRGGASRTPGTWATAVGDELARRSPSGRKDLVAPGTVVAPAAFDPEVHDLGAPMRFISQVIPEGPELTGDSFTYWKQTVRTNNAAVVAKGEKKPTSIFTAEKITDEVKTVAHLTEPIPRSDLDDAQALEDFLESELRLGALLEVDAEILYGDPAGTPEGMNGLANEAIQAQPFDTDLLTTARKAITLIEIGGLAQPSAFLLNPADWERAELSTASGSGEYHLPTAPVDRARATLWGVPVVVSTEVTEGVAFVGDFARQARYYEREGVRIEWSENVYDPTFDAGAGATDFERNLIRFRAEARANVAWLRPAAFAVFGTFTGASS